MVSTPEFAYIDESGDTGAVANGGSKTYTLACVLIPMAGWTDALDRMVQLRREIRSTYGLSMAEEVKANSLVGCKRVYRDLGMGDGQLRDVYRQHLQATVEVSSGVGAIVVNKYAIKNTSVDIFRTAWEYLFTRLRMRSGAKQQPILVVHDDGEADRVRKHLRKFRRMNWQGGTYGPARLLIEDPVPRDSQHSYFIQLADLLAYSASRYALPTTGKSNRVCDETMWSELDAVQVKELSLRRDGVYMWPTK